MQGVAGKGVVSVGDVRDALDASVAAAKHLTQMDMAAVQAARALADKIDAWDVIVEWALDDAAQTSGRPAVPANDNVSLASFLKYCEQLGLTPAARKAAAAPAKPAAPEVAREPSGIAKLQAVVGGRAG